MIRASASLTLRSPKSSCPGSRGSRCATDSHARSPISTSCSATTRCARWWRPIFRLEPERRLLIQGSARRCDRKRRRLIGSGGGPHAGHETLVAPEIFPFAIAPCEPNAAAAHPIAHDVPPLLHAEVEDDVCIRQHLVMHERDFAAACESHSFDCVDAILLQLIG